MKKATKTWKIGEYAKGGIVQVNVKNSVAEINCLDWDSKECIESINVDMELSGASRTAYFWLNDITTSYYSDIITKWIESKTKK